MCIETVTTLPDLRSVCYCFIKRLNLFKTFSMVIILSHVFKTVSIRHHCSQNEKHITETNPENSLNYPITITFFHRKC